MKRFYIVALLFVLLLPIAVYQYRQPLVLAYHRHQMEAKYNAVFGNPRPVGNGLAAYDVNGIDVESVLQDYAYHRDRLVSLKSLMTLKYEFPRLRAVGATEQSEARSAFTRRMWAQFPRHRYFSLSPDGIFETWFDPSMTEEWQRFLDQEASNTQ